MRLLDAFSCEGAAGRGYQAAGFTVHGVDISARVGKRYPGTFTHADAVQYIRDHGHEYDAIHASPPCQAYSISTAGNQVARDKWPRLIEATRDALVSTGRPWVIENVTGAKRELRNPTTLCWSMFHEPGSVLDEDGEPLRMERHRLFETSFALDAPRQCYHPRDVQVAGVYGGARGRRPGDDAAAHRLDARTGRKGGYVPKSRTVREQLLGVPANALTINGMNECIPPAYAEWVGHALATHIKETE